MQKRLFGWLFGGLLALALTAAAPTAAFADCSSQCRCDTSCDEVCGVDEWGYEITCGQAGYTCGGDECSCGYRDACYCSGGSWPSYSSEYAGSFAYETGDWCRFAWVTQRWVEEGNRNCPYYRNPAGCDYDWRQRPGGADVCCAIWGCSSGGDPCQG